MPQPVWLGMQHKVFFGKYRVTTTKSEQWWETCRSYFRCEAEEIASGKGVALELIPLVSLGESERRELERIAAAASHIRHPNLMALYASGVTGSYFVQVVEDVCGVSVMDWVGSHGPVSPEIALGLALQVATALRVMARHALPQPSIFPDEVLLVPGETGQQDCPLVKLGHFFAAAPSHFDGWPSVRTEATPFLSPEQLAGAPLDFRSKVYSLGALLWFLLTGAPPALPSVTAKEQSSPRLLAAPLPELAPIPECVRRLLSRLLAKNRDERPVDPISLEATIRACLCEMGAEKTGEGDTKPAVTTRRRARRPVWQRAGITLLATAGAAAMVAIAFAVAIDNATATRGVRKPDSSGANSRGRETKPTAPERVLNAAMNFAVGSPLFRDGRAQIQSIGQLLGRTPGPENWSELDPEPPAEGPAGPTVEIVTQIAREPVVRASTSVAPALSVHNSSSRLQPSGEKKTK